MSVRKPSGPVEIRQSFCRKRPGLTGACWHHDELGARAFLKRKRPVAVRRKSQRLSGSEPHGVRAVHVAHVDARRRADALAPFVEQNGLSVG